MENLNFSRRVDFVTFSPALIHGGHFFAPACQARRAGTVPTRNYNIMYDFSRKLHHARDFKEQLADGGLLRFGLSADCRMKDCPSLCGGVPDVRLINTGAKPIPGVLFVIYSDLHRDGASFIREREGHVMPSFHWGRFVTDNCLDRTFLAVDCELAPFLAAQILPQIHCIAAIAITPKPLTVPIHTPGIGLVVVNYMVVLNSPIMGFCFHNPHRRSIPPLGIATIAILKLITSVT